MSQLRSRTAEVKCGEQWMAKNFDEILKGDTFRLREPEGGMVYHMGTTEFVAEEDAKDGSVLMNVLRNAHE